MKAREFEAWTANLCEVACMENISPESLRETVESRAKFEAVFRRANSDLKEVLLFAQFCRLSSKNDPSDDRWWYLLEALKESLKFKLKK